MSAPIKPPYDPELEASLKVSGIYVLDLDPANLAAVQRDLRAMSLTVRESLENEGLIVEDHSAKAPDGADIPFHHVHDADTRAPRPCLVYIHGGGLVLGTPWDSAPEFRRWIEDFGASVITVDYRLAPQVTAPTLVEDCYAVVHEVHARAAELGIDPDGIVLVGLSAGGGLAAGTALLARDRQGPPLCGQLLLAPMLDPDADGDSARQHPDGPWNRVENTAAWKLALGDAEAVGASAPARADSLKDLPPALLEVGSAELFRTEVVEYATRIWRVGGDAELHVWSGGFHGFGSYVHAAVAQGAIDARRNWLARRLGRVPRELPAAGAPAAEEPASAAPASA